MQPLLLQQGLLGAGAPPLWAYQRGQSRPDQGEAVDADQDPGPGEEEERSLVCRRCRGRVTSSRHAVEVNGQQQHTFFNPAGILFEIGCFDAAPGCLVRGDPTCEFTWFPGFAWRYALCAGCHQHLGWRFESEGARGFFGLVLKHLIEEA